MSIKIENIVPPSVEQWQGVIRGMRNPMNSWAKSDSTWDMIEDPSPINPDDMVYIKIGENDLNLMRRLANAGSDHRKFLRMLPVMMDVTAPLYWWKEYDTYKVGTVANSCSTMHKIAEKEFTLDQFSHEWLLDSSLCCLEETIEQLNFWREKYILQSHKETFDESCVSAEECWMQMIQLLPSSYNQKRTLFLNYEVLWNMYQSRKGHKLQEWRRFCQMIADKVPYFAEIFEIEAS